MKKEEQWAENVLNSLNNIEKAKPSEHVFDKIESIIKTKEKSDVISISHLKWIAAAAIAIIAINIYVLNLWSETSQKQTEYSENNTSLLSNYSF